MDNKFKEIAGSDEVDYQNMILTKQRLYEVLLATYNKVEKEITKQKKYYEDRFYSKDEAVSLVIEKYRPELLNNQYETKIIVSFRDACEKALNKEGLDFIDYISTELTPLMSVYCSFEDINEKESYTKQIIEMLTDYEIVRRLTNSKNIVEASSKDIQQEDTHIVNIRNTIESEFYNKGEIDWSFAFRHENDFKLFVLLLTKFFMGVQYDLCNTISLRPRCKTRLARILREIHNALSEDPLRSDEKYLELIRVLSPYKDDSKLYSTLTK